MKPFILLTFLATMLLAGSAGAAQVDYFLKIPGIEGESTDAAYPDAIPLDAFEWQMSRDTNDVGGPIILNDFRFSAKAGKASPKLFLSCATGQHLSEATLYLRRAGDSAQEYYKIKLTHVIVTSYSTGGGVDDGAIPMETGDSDPIDEVVVHYESIEVVHTADDGTETRGEASRTEAR